MSLISIITPSYNAASYLRKTIDSIIVQSNNNWELIIINDASTDDSYKILETYDKKHSKIKLIKFDKNKGQGFARNYAIERAKGKYIIFLDADDFLDKEALTILNKRIAKNPNTNVFLWGYQTKTMDSKNENKYIPQKPDKEKNETPFTLGMLGRKGFTVYPWVYIAKREFLLKNNVRFAEGIFFEDLQYSTQLLYYAKRVKLIKKICYYYRKHPDSVTGCSSKQKIDDKFTAFVGVKRFLLEQGAFQQFQDLYLVRFLAFCVHTSFNEYFVLPKSERDKELDNYMFNIRKSKLLRKENLLLLRNLGLSLPQEEKAARKAYLSAYYGMKHIKHRYLLYRAMVQLFTYIYRKRNGLVK